MPIPVITDIDAQTANTISDDKNCGLAALADYVSPFVGTPKFNEIQARNGNSLLRAVQEMSGDPTLRVEDLPRMLRGLETVSRQRTFGKLFRSIAPSACRHCPGMTPERLKEIGEPGVSLRAIEIQYIAAQFGGRVEAYDFRDSSTDLLAGRHEISVGDREHLFTLPLVLDSRNPRSFHWRYFPTEMSAAQLKAHNKAIKRPKIYDDNVLDPLLVDAIKKRQSLRKVFEQYEATALSANNPLSSMLGMLKPLLGDAATSKLAGAFDTLPKEGFFGKISDFMGLVPIFSAFSQMIANVFNPGQPLTVQEQAGHFLGGILAASVAKLPEKEAEYFTSRWKNEPDPKKGQILGEVFNALNLRDADNMLRQAEDKLLSVMKESGVPATDVRVFEEDLKAWRKVEFSEAKAAYQRENIAARVQRLRPTLDAFHKFEQDKKAAPTTPVTFDRGLVTRLMEVNHTWVNHDAFKGAVVDQKDRLEEEALRQAEAVKEAARQREIAQVRHEKRIKKLKAGS